MPELGAPHGGNRMTDTRKVIVNGTEYEVELEGEGTTWKAAVGGQSFDIEMPEAAVAAKPRRSGGRKKKKSGTVSANIPGKVVTVEVEEGQEVVEGQVILILEAMKMQTTVYALTDGVVDKFEVQVGDQVESKDLLVQLR